MKRVLITGASGFLGSYCFDALRRRNFEVILTARTAPTFEHVGAIFRRCDLNDEIDTVAMLDEEQPTHLLHLAWYAEPGEFWRSTKNIEALIYSLHLVNAFLARGGKHVAAIGSCAEYEVGESSGEPYRENAALTDATLYAAAKNAFHRVAAKLAIDTSTRLAWARVFFVYGRRESSRKFISSTALALLRGECVTLAQPRRRLDYVHARDVGEALAALVDAEADGAFNIGSGSATTPLEIATIVASFLGVGDLIKMNSGTSGHDIVADRSRIYEDVGWEPREDLVPTIEDVVASVTQPLDLRAP